MFRNIYINGQFLSEEEAKISVMDRGFLFADGVYEVSAVYNGKLVDNKKHLNRLHRSLSELEINLDKNIEEIENLQTHLIKKNNLTNGLIYLQVTRGTAERDFNYPDDIKPNFVMFTQEKDITKTNYFKNGVKAITVEDIRWQRRDVKSTSLLPQVLAKNQARKKGAFEAIMIENGFVTESSSANVFIIKNNKIITRNLSNKILSGITREAILELAKENKIEIEERLFSKEELYNADECFLTSATNFILGVTEIDGKRVSNSVLGQHTLKLQQIYLNFIKL